MAAATLALDNLVFPNYQEIDASHDHSAMMPDDDESGDEQEKPEDATTKPVEAETTAPTDQSSVTTDSNVGEEKKGCGATVTAGALTLLMTVALAGMTLYKKED